MTITTETLLLADNVLTDLRPVLLVDRFNAHFQAQPQMTPAAKQLLCAHVSLCDFPETVETYAEFGRQAGFTSMEVIYTDPQQMGRLMVMQTAAGQQT